MPNDDQIEEVKQSPVVDCGDNLAEGEEVDLGAEDGVSSTPHKTPCAMITGEAGTGKTYLTQKRIEEDPLYGVLCATTGIAAVNLGGTTINSLLGFFDTASLIEAFQRGRITSKIHQIAARGYKNIIVDEGSMLVKDQLDIIYRALTEVNAYKSMKKRGPLGLIVIGDVCQLPPIVDKNERKRGEKTNPKWLFKANVWEKAFAPNIVRLTKVWRQSQPQFLQAINHLRRGQGKSAVEVLDTLTKFEWSVDQNFDGTTIMATNQEVDRHNFICLQKIDDKLIQIDSARWGKQSGEWKNIPEQLELKIGAYVMILSNDSPAFSYVNGDTGHIVDYNETLGFFSVELKRTGETVQIRKIHRTINTYNNPDPAISPEDYPPATWDFIPFGKVSYDEKKEIWHLGGVRYFPLRLAWASSVHKCVHPDTIVFTTTGPMQIKDVKIGTSIYSGEGHTYHKVKAVAKVPQQLWKVTIRRGYELMASGDHPIKVIKDQRISFQSPFYLQIDDKIVLSHGCNHGEYIEGSFAWLLGVLIGDGSYRDQRDGTVEICKTDKGLWRLAAEVLKKFHIRLVPRKDERGAYFVSKTFREKLKNEFGLGYDLAPNKDIPLKIWGGNPRVRGEFLSGLFDTDGHVGKSTIILTTSSDKLAKSVQLMLLSLDILSSRGVYRVLYEGAYRPYYQVRISRAFFRDFRIKVGFKKEDKKKALAAFPAPRNNCLKRLSELADTVKMVEDLCVIIPMIDLEVDVSSHDEQIFAANGIVTHNSQGLSLDACQIDFRHPFFGSPAMAYVAISRCRTPEGLRLVGRQDELVKRCCIDPDVIPWL